MLPRLGPGRSILWALLFTISFTFALGTGEARAESCARLFHRLQRAKISPEDAEILDRGVLGDFDDLTEVVPPSKAAAKAWDRRVQAALQALPMPQVGKGELASLKQEQIDDLFQRMKSNKVMETTCHSPNKYDPDVNNQIGFCFGRALGGHLLARNMGLTNDSIRKVWAVGSMEQDKIYWQHHVAISVRRDDGQWIVLDPFDDHALPLADWFKEYSDSSTNGKLMLFATQADRFGPGSPEPIYDGTVKDGYNDFFLDLFRSARQEGQSLKKQLRMLSE